MPGVHMEQRGQRAPGGPRRMATRSISASEPNTGAIPVAA